MNLIFHNPISWTMSYCKYAFLWRLKYALTFVSTVLYMFMTYYFIIFVIVRHILYKCFHLFYIWHTLYISAQSSLSWTQIGGMQYIHRTSFEKFLKYFCCITFSTFNRVKFIYFPYSQMFQHPNSINNPNYILRNDRGVFLGLQT